MAREMRNCTWDGCPIRTADSSGLCHNHRRMSLPVRQKVANMVPGQSSNQMRLAGIPMMTMARPEAASWVNGITAKSIEAMNDKPLPTMNPDGSVTIHRFWSPGQGDDQVYWPGIGMVRGDGRAGFLREGNVLHVQSNRVARTEDVIIAAHKKWEHDVVSVHGIQRSDMERYGDTAEAMAQLHMGDYDGYSIMFAAEEDDSQMVRFMRGSEVYVAFMKYQHPWITRRGGIAPRYRFTSVTDGRDTGTPDEVEDANFRRLLDSIEHVRNVIESNKFEGEDHILLPMGWTDVAPPDYVD